MIKIKLEIICVHHRNKIKYNSIFIAKYYDTT